MSTPMRICMWFKGDAEDAAKFYAATFPDSSVGAIMRAPGDYPDGREGDVLTVDFTVLGIQCMGLNGGDYITPNESVSFVVTTTTQEETDRYWNAIIDHGGKASECGWCKDRWGFSWQITPKQLVDGLSDPDEATRKRVFAAMMTMSKIDIAAIEAARKG